MYLLAGLAGLAMFVDVASERLWVWASIFLMHGSSATGPLDVFGFAFLQAMMVLCAQESAARTAGKLTPRAP